MTNLIRKTTRIYCEEFVCYVDMTIKPLLAMFFVASINLVLLASVLSADELKQSSGFRCVPSVRETGVTVWQKNDEIKVRVVSPMGYKFMPQLEGPLSAFDLNLGKTQIEELSALGDHFELSWSKNNCTLKPEQFTINCQGQGQISVAQIQIFGVSTSEIVEKYRDETYEQRKFRFSFEKEGNYFSSLQYFTKSCAVF